MIREYLLRIGSILVTLVVLSGCGAAAEPTPVAPVAAPPTTMSPTTAVTTTTVAGPGSDRRALLAGMVEQVILPHHRTLVDESALLEQQVQQFADDPTVDTLAAAQAQWRTTAAAWAQVEPFSLRFTMLATGQIKKWPINTKFIEEFIAETATIDEPFIASIGATAKGIGAIEYFLFSPTLTADEVVAALVDTPQRLAYLVALTQNLTNAAEELYALWAPEGENGAQRFVDADFSENNVQGSISMLTNELIVLLETMVKTKVEYPLRGVMADPQPQAVESPYAGDSWPLMAANLRTVQQVFQAGLGDYLDQMAVTPRTPTLSAAIDAQLEATIAAIEALKLPLEVAVIEDPAPVRAVRDEIKDLLVLLKVDMANQLGITVTFSDNDGD